ncbi:hypothetical protein [Streptomyces sp. AN091965]|uniref:hypothetical protein n=1 Tax=Streptomyces sp. AN091965 TaxID=2927803 RepID=UPI001F614EC0|nr:hypothetical protein [Streptomyces sp. AN091965]MCI3932848.1 hypothetical protein [Streptomyces sp. AN091965]
MALQDDLTAIQRCVDDLVRTVGRIERQAEADAAGVDFRRVRMDTDHLRESVALLRAAVAPASPTGHQTQAPPPPARPAMVPVPDTPYDSSLWTDSDDEGLGARYRRAP